MESSPKRSSKKAIIVSVVVFVVLMLIPVGLVKVYWQMSDKAKTDVFQQQQIIGNLAVSALDVKLNNLVNIASSMAASTSLRSYVAKGKWESAANVTRDMQNDVNFYDPFIDRIIIYDANGVQQAAYPTLTGGLGSSAVSSSWYAALAGKDLSSYVSNVAKRLSLPRIQVVSIAVPIKTGSSTVSGFIVMQIPAANFLAFTENMTLGTYGFAYVVDSSGNLVVHPKYSAESESVASFASVAVVQKVMSGKSGTEIVTDPKTGQQSVVTYRPIPEFGWGLVEQELSAEAFSGRVMDLSQVELLLAILTLVNILIAYLIFRVLGSSFSPKKGDREGFTLIELLVVIAIIAILSVVVVLTLNPAQLLAQSRDSNRISDFATLKSALSLYLVDASIPNLASSTYGYNACYLSTVIGLGTTTAKCGMFTNSYTVDASTTSALYRTNATQGWIPVNFSQLSYGSPMSALPVDPTNNATYYYGYAATSTGGFTFELDAFMESNKYNASGTSDVETTDGGDNPKTYEQGNRPGANL